MSSTWIEIAGWALLWVATGTVYVLMVRRGIDYVRQPGWVALYFAAASFLVALPFREVLAPRLASLRVGHGILLAVTICLQIVGYRFGARRWTAPASLIRAYPHIYWLPMDPRYHVSKPFEILFQQTLVVSLVSLLATHGWSLAGIIPVMVGVFALLHVPIIPLVGRFFGLYYLGASIIAAVAFPWLILARSDGFVFVYCAHWLFYLLSALSFRRFPGWARYPRRV